MLLSKRERFIGMVTGVLLGVLVFYWLIYTPLSDRITDLDQQIAKAQNDLDDYNMLLGKKRNLEQEWSSMSRNATFSRRSPTMARLSSVLVPERATWLVS